MPTLKLISAYVDPGTYEALRDIAKSRGQSTAELIRVAMSEFVERERQRPSILEIAPLPGRPGS